MFIFENYCMRKIYENVSGQWQTWDTEGQKATGTLLPVFIPERKEITETPRWTKKKKSSEFQAIIITSGKWYEWPCKGKKKKSKSFFFLVFVLQVSNF